MPAKATETDAERLGKVQTPHQLVAELVASLTPAQRLDIVKHQERGGLVYVQLAFT